MLFYCKFWKIWQNISRWLLLVIEWFCEELLLPVGGKNLMFQHYFAIISPWKLILQYVLRVPVTSINSKYFLVLMRMFWRPSFHALLSSSLRIVEIQNLSFPEVNFQEIIKESPISSLFKIAAKAKSGSEIYTYHHVYLKFRKYIRKVFTCNCFSWNTEHPLW